jgi:hypothetical protein
MEETMKPNELNERESRHQMPVIVILIAILLSCTIGAAAYGLFCHLARIAVLP